MMAMGFVHCNSEGERVSTGAQQQRFTEVHWASRAVPTGSYLVNPGKQGSDGTWAMMIR